MSPILIYRFQYSMGNVEIRVLVPKKEPNKLHLHTWSFWSWNRPRAELINPHSLSGLDLRIEYLHIKICVWLKQPCMLFFKHFHKGLLSHISQNSDLFNGRYWDLKIQLGITSGGLGPVLTVCSFTGCPGGVSTSMDR